ncbi:zinc-binding dehydrogenase [Leucobacter sp. Marseille-Q4368]|uniref:Zinc-binding dehydrogenase n=2 Tax=Leucobacter manosquensis TaxID=2810611 RepID=A0ABS5M5I4_9MICO|nr:zinc-binding dehydrogenase [Leucobacter manosquensis]MBS3182458.1 zinc-binding dehydrogenase [Leucobacter manosquensis]
MTGNALLFEGVGSEPYLQSIETRPPRHGEVLVKLEAAGICHSDLHVLKGEWPIWERTALGHEGAGIVVGLGEGTTGLTVGDRVILSWYAACGYCSACVDGKTWLCSKSNAVNHMLPDGTTPLSAKDGRPVQPYLGVSAFSEYAVVPREAVVKVPHEVPPEIAALIGCAVTTGVGAVLNTAGVKAGETAVVVGAGGVGQAIVLGLRLSGASKVIVLDPSEERLEIAAQLGATDVIDGMCSQRFEKVKELTDGEGVDFVFDAIGISRVTADVMKYLKYGGAAVLVGMPAKDDKVTIDHWPLVYSGQRILGCHYGSSRPQADFVKIARLYLSGLLPLDQLVGDRIPQTQISDAILGLEKAAGKRVVVDFKMT